MFSLLLFVVYSFTIYRMLFQIPSWLNSHSKTDIFFLASYVFTVALIECALLFGFILLINLILPGKFFRSQFVAQGSLVVAFCTIWAVYLKYFSPGYDYNDLREPFGWLLLFFASMLILLVASSRLMERYRRIEELIGKIADRMIIFSWLYAPLGLFSLFLVMLRNIF